MSRIKEAEEVSTIAKSMIGVCNQQQMVRAHNIEQNLAKLTMGTMYGVQIQRPDNLMKAEHIATVYGIDVDPDQLPKKTLKSWTRKPWNPRTIHWNPRFRGRGILRLERKL